MFGRNIFRALFINFSIGLIMQIGLCLSHGKKEISLEKYFDQVLGQFSCDLIFSPLASLFADSNQGYGETQAFFEKKSDDQSIPHGSNDSSNLRDIIQKENPDYGVQCSANVGIPNYDEAPCLNNPAFFDIGREDAIPNYSTLRFNVGAAFGDFIGFNENYAEFGVFASPGLYSSWLPFIDLHGYRLEKNNCWAASVGIGLRYWDDCFERLWGGNIYYDYRETFFQRDINHDSQRAIKRTHHRGFSRLGFGLESLGDCYDVRANGYVPIGTTHYNGNKFVFDRYAGGYVASYKRKEFIYYGIDLEVGKEFLNYCDWSLYGAAGPYYYSNRHLNNFWGMQGRIELNWREFLNFEGNYSYDDIFHSRFQGKALLSVPLEVFACFGDYCNDVCKLFYTQRVRRNQIPFVKGKCCWKWNW